MGCTWSYLSQTTLTNGRGRRVITRTWHNGWRAQLHRTAAHAWEDWTILPGGVHVLSFQAWFRNGAAHRVGRPAVCRWHVANDGTRVLVDEVWRRHGHWHRVDGPSYRHWTMEPDGMRILQCVWWYVNGRLHRVDGPAYEGHGFYWHGVEVRQEDLPWLRRGRSFLVGLPGFTGATPTLCGDGDGRAGGSGSPAWTQDARVMVVWNGGGAGDAVVPMYRSAVGGAVMLSV